MSTFEEAVQAFDPASVQASVNKAEDQRQETLQRYPLESWPAMPLESYAQGQEGNPPNFCTWIERGATEMGSIRGGSAAKLIIYKHANKPGWHYPPGYADEYEAWNAVRAGFTQAFELAEQSEWSAIDEIEALQRGPALVIKTLWAYFPGHLLPICSTAHLHHFLDVAGADGDAKSGLGPVGLNRLLLERLLAFSALSELSTKQLERFLYRSFSPFDGEMYKIATGDDGEFWTDFQEQEIACVGWDEVGDLLAFETEESFRQAFESTYGEEYDRRNKLSEKANELWTLVNMTPGDLVVANRGTSDVLGVGRVIPPGYEWNDEREQYKHTVRVKWEEGSGGPISPQRHWALKTVKRVNSRLRDEILALRGGGQPAEPMLKEIERVLDRKGQVILYGPPGTGKTFHAKRFAEWWLEKTNGHSPRLFGSTGETVTASGRTWVVTINKKQDFSWEQLIESGSQPFVRGRPDKNFDEVEIGDLVIGYTATPVKKIEALARVSGLYESEKGPSFVLAPIQLVDGPTWAEIKADAVLSQSQPVRNNMYGTLFRLSAEEAASLLGLIADSNDDLEDLSPQLSDAPATDQGGELEWVTFHPSYSYEDFIEGFRPDLDAGTVKLDLVPGILKRLSDRARRDLRTNFLLVIDEINRANVAKVFGELITLIEKDKRGQLSSALPYSKKRFSIPPNVYIVGTMNTADRSIRLLDVALRRRFGFIELMPDMTLLQGASLDVDLASMMQSVNARIRELIGREKQIGHSYFLAQDGQPVGDVSELAEILRSEVLPLLQEYAFDDYDTLEALLGPKIVDAPGLSLRNDVLDDDQALVEALEEFALQEEPSPDA